MLDDTTTPDTIAASQDAWKATLSYGDIVAYRFPVAEEDGTQEPKVRPCLILDVERISDAVYALLAYGTSARTMANRGYEVRVLGERDYRPAGLRKPTRFVGARRLLVSLDAGGFDVATATGSPVLGRLRGDAFERMNAVRCRIHAERDIAADRRASRRNGLRRRRPTKPFTVEHRHPKRRARPAGDAA